MKNLQLAATLNEIADLLEILGENPFRIRAYRRAARSIELLPESIETVWREGRLQEIEGVGKGLAAGIEQWLAEGVMDAHEELKRRIPRGLLEVVRVPGVGPKTAKLLYDALGVQSLADLEEACRAGRVRTIKGLGPKTEENILRGIERLRRFAARTPIGVALPLAQGIVAELAALPAVRRAAYAGSLRRGRETVGDIDVLVASSAPDQVIEAFVALPGVEHILSRGQEKASVLLAQGLQVDLLVVPEEQFAAALHHFTGSKEHNVTLRELARARGLRISEHGIVDEATGAAIPVLEEEDIFSALGLPFIPPELREDGSEISAARAGVLPRLVELSDIRGDLHVHSTWSDGRASIREMAEAARARGYEYIAITDHSKSLGVARGLSPERLVQQIEEIRALNRLWDDFQILAGAEVDILPDGTLDYDDELLRRLDIVVASVHSAMNQDRETMTERIIKAMRHPCVDIVAHPTGRVLGRREAYDVDVERLIVAAAETGTCLEINASPERLDLSDVYARAAKDAGVWLAINTDAHDVESLQQMALGVVTARRGWVEKRHVLNCLPLPELRRTLKRGRACV